MFCGWCIPNSFLFLSALIPNTSTHTVCLKKKERKRRACVVCVSKLAWDRVKFPSWTYSLSTSVCEISVTIATCNLLAVKGERIHSADLWMRWTTLVFLYPVAAKHSYSWSTPPLSQRERETVNECAATLFPEWINVCTRSPTDNSQQTLLHISAALLLLWLMSSALLIPTGPFLRFSKTFAFTPSLI